MNTYKRTALAALAGLAVFGFFAVHGTSWSEPSTATQQEVSQAMTPTADFCATLALQDLAAYGCQR